MAFQCSDSPTWWSTATNWTIVPIILVPCTPVLAQILTSDPPASEQAPKICPFHCHFRTICPSLVVFPFPSSPFFRRCFILDTSPSQDLIENSARTWRNANHDGTHHKLFEKGQVWSTAVSKAFFDIKRHVTKAPSMRLSDFICIWIRTWHFRVRNRWSA